MSSLKTITKRHARDHWKDAVFIIGAVLLTALSIGSVTSKAQGKTTEHPWTLSVNETPEMLR